MEEEQQAAPVEAQEQLATYEQQPVPEPTAMQRFYAHWERYSWWYIAALIGVVLFLVVVTW